MHYVFSIYIYACLEVKINKYCNDYTLRTLQVFKVNFNFNQFWPGLLKWNTPFRIIPSKSAREKCILLQVFAMLLLYLLVAQLEESLCPSMSLGAEDPNASSSCPRELRRWLSIRSARSYEKRFYDQRGRNY